MSPCVPASQLLFGRLSGNRLASSGITWIKVEAFSDGPSSRAFNKKIAQFSKLFLPRPLFLFDGKSWNYKWLWNYQANGFQTLMEKSMFVVPKKLTIKISASNSKYNCSSLEKRWEVQWLSIALCSLSVLVLIRAVLLRIWSWDFGGGSNFELVIAVNQKVKNWNLQLELGHQKKLKQKTIIINIWNQKNFHSKQKIEFCLLYSRIIIELKKKIIFKLNGEKVVYVIHNVLKYSNINFIFLK